MESYVTIVKDGGVSLCVDDMVKCSRQVFKLKMQILEVYIQQCLLWLYLTSLYVLP